MKKIDCFSPFINKEQCQQLCAAFEDFTSLVNIHTLKEGLYQSNTLQQVAKEATAPYIFLLTKDTPLSLHYRALQRLVQLAEDTQAALLYADHYQIKAQKRINSPVIDCQLGSLRDDFNLGSLLFFNTAAFKTDVLNLKDHYQRTALYALHLCLGRHHRLVHVNGYLYTEIEEDSRKGGEKQFDYVDPCNQEHQKEMERMYTEHLKAIGDYLEPMFKEVDFSLTPFEYEVSVIIPIRNRIGTIEAAIQSVLHQQTNFKFNLVMIDNHSDDGTSEIVDQHKDDECAIHLAPQRTDLGIGGCQNYGLHHANCGKFAVQLGSDDLYSDEHTLQAVVDAFYQQQCAMVIGTYHMIDFDLNTLPPGVIGHREWTPENGRNSALRISGLGAPRAFYTPIAREIGLPNTGYSEDYAMGLNISRHYQMGRIYDVLYLCHRQGSNSDTALNIEQVNANNIYKDRIRTWEL